MPSSPRPPSTDQRIAKLLARAGVASRREVERMIADGRVALNGTPVDTPATILASLHGVTVDGQPVEAAAPARLFVYHKPTGLLVTERDPRGRPTIYDRLPRDLPRVVPVGRLDLNTEGLLLLTTDGGFKRQLELPATGVERSYRARAYGTISQAQLEELIHGIEIEGVRYGQIDANLERRTGANVWIEMTLTEGKNREVRRVLEYLGLSVSRLIRTRYGPFVLGDLPPGMVGEVRQNDLIAFCQTLARKGGATDARIAVLPPAPARSPAATPRQPAARGEERPARGAARATQRPDAPSPRTPRAPTMPRQPALRGEERPARGAAPAGHRPDASIPRAATMPRRPTARGEDLPLAGSVRATGYRGASATGRPPRRTEPAATPVPGERRARPTQGGAPVPGLRRGKQATAETARTVAKPARAARAAKHRATQDPRPGDLVERPRRAGPAGGRGASRPPAPGDRPKRGKPRPPRTRS